MAPPEPLTIGWILTFTGVLVMASVLFSRPSERLGFPAVLLFLGLGLLAGEWLPIRFDDYSLAFRIGTVALVLILFDGGLNTPLHVARAHLAPAALLATVGVVGTAAIVAVGARLLGLGWIEAMLVGAIVSSTDAAAVFAALRGSNVQLRRRVGATLELESGLNDPMAVLLTFSLTALLLAPDEFSWSGLLLQMVLQLGIGVIAGLVIGWCGQQLLARVRVPAAGLYPAMTLALALLAFGLPTLFLGSGFLAVYVAALMLGNRRLPYRAGILRVHDALAWLGQISMFLVLGLLAVPSVLASWGVSGLVLALVLALIARPAIVTLCLLPFGYPPRERAFIAWTGLRGAVPILLASYPVMRGVDGAVELFHLVFFIVVVNAVLPGMTVRRAADWLGVERAGQPRPSPVLEITATESLPVRILSFYLDPAAMACGSRVGDLPLPDGADVLLLVRDGRIQGVQDNTRLNAGDHVHLMIEPEQTRSIELLFGLREED
ncbi:MAG: potassium/proton antiporter [Wenzhouxiangellaceae bacterium]|nr:potassium/proton antiporter [Wenzhouxiangellaceae bacterium]